MITESENGYEFSIITSENNKDIFIQITEYSANGVGMVNVPMNILVHTVNEIMYEMLFDDANKIHNTMLSGMNSDTMN